MMANINVKINFGGKFVFRSWLFYYNCTIQESFSLSFGNVVNVETEMTQEEVEQFEEDWSNLWNPQEATLLE